MITNHGEFIEVIHAVKDSEIKAWIIKLDDLTEIPLYAGNGLWHLPWNGSRFEGMILLEEPYKTREEMVMELLMSNCVVAV